MLGTMDVIKEIVSEVKGQISISIDGGFRTGVDILKAIALGADAVYIGRPIAIAVVGMGAEGTTYYLKEIKKELEKAMILTGCNSIKDISPDIIKELK